MSLYFGRLRRVHNEGYVKLPSIERSIFEEIQETNQLLREIVKTLQEMKKQEKDYWETWKKAKREEN